MNTHEDIITPIIVHCRVSTTKAIEFKSGLGFKKSDLVTTKKQLVLKRIINIFGNKRVLQQCYVLSYYTDLYLPKYK